MAAYAAEQAACEEAHASGWAAKWAPVREQVKAVLNSMASGAPKIVFPPLQVDINLQLEDEAEEGDEDDEDL